MSRLPKNAKILEYKIVDHLGVGGFAHTYQAIDTNLNKKVAIKEFFPPHLCRRDEDFRIEPVAGGEAHFRNYLANFIEEARILAKFDQPNIVKVLRYFEALGTAFIIMEFVNGKPVGEYFAYDNVIGEERVLRWLLGLLRGLEAVHGADVIHGDIKPKNIIINDEDEAVLIDFGASVIYKTAFETAEPFDELHLSPGYAAPEQLAGGGAGLDHRIDLYALGGVFYEAIAGEKPAMAQQDRVDITSDVLRYEKYYNRKLLASIAQSLQADPDARFDTAGRWIEFISLSPGERLGRFLKRNRTAIAALSLVCSAMAYAIHYVLVNEIDEKSYKYKLLASTSEVLDLVRIGDQYRQKLRDAIAYLGDYGNQYRSHADRILPEGLVTGRNNRSSLENVHGAIDETRQKLKDIDQAIMELQDKYYFDDYRIPLALADEVIKQFGLRQKTLNRALFNAYIEYQIVVQAAALGLEIDRVALSSLMTELEGETSELDLDSVVTVGEPIIRDFLDSERDRNALAAFEALKQETIGQIRVIADGYQKNRRHGEFDAIIEQARISQRPNQLDLARKSADALAAAIDRDQAAAAKARARQKRQAEVRALINAIDSNMIEIKPGAFRMGSNNHGYSRPPRTVNVLPFFVLKNEVVNAQWNQCVKSKKCRKISNGNGDSYPVTQVSWKDTQNFIQWLNSRSTRFNYRLPTEAEWEYIVRRHGYILEELDSDLSSVSVRQTNERGVNSIVGNALEWLDDCWHGGFVGAPGDSRSWNKGLQCDKRVVRGSNWRGEYDINEDNVTYFRPFGLGVLETRPALGFRLAGTLK